jgi:hypothetical protein
VKRALLAAAAGIAVAAGYYATGVLLREIGADIDWDEWETEAGEVAW